MRAVQWVSIEQDFLNELYAEIEAQKLVIGELAEQVAQLEADRMEDVRAVA